MRDNAQLAKSSMLKVLIIIMLTGLSLVLVLSCKTPTVPPATTNTSPTPPTGDIIAVDIKGSAFTPATITPMYVTTVTWTNRDTVVHTITSDTGLFDKSLNPGDSFSYTFSKVGSFGYHCANNAEMKGMVSMIHLMNPLETMPAANP